MHAVHVGSSFLGCWRTLLLSSMSPKRKRRAENADSDNVKYEGLKAALRAATSRLNVLERKKRRQDQRQNGEKLSGFMRKVLLLLYLLSGYTPTCAVSYWSYIRKRKRLAVLPESECSRVVEDLFLHSNPVTVWDLSDDSSPVDENVRKRAWWWMTRYKLRSWVRDANASKGLAPSSRLLIRQYNGLLQDIPFVIRPAPRDDPAACSYSRVFLRRWRLSVGSRWARIRVRDYVSLEEKRQKVVFVSCFVFFRFFVLFLGPKVGYMLTPFFGPLLRF